MRKLVLSALMLVAVPVPATAQQFGFGAKLGSLGVGVDGAWAVNDRIGLRGGIAFVPGGFFLNDAFPSDIEGVESDFALPSTSFTLGVDVGVAGPFRLMGGLLLRSDDIEATGELTEETEIGDGVYGPGGTLRLTLEQSSVMPYAGVGFGTVHRSGLGVFLDLALAFAGGGEVVLDASDELTSIPGFQDDLAVAEAELNDEVGSWGSLYPIVQFGLRYGLGR